MSQKGYNHSRKTIFVPKFLSHRLRHYTGINVTTSWMNVKKHLINAIKLQELSSYNCRIDLSQTYIPLKKYNFIEKACSLIKVTKKKKKPNTAHLIFVHLD